MNEQNNDQLVIENHKKYNNSIAIKKTKKHNWVNKWLTQTAIFYGDNKQLTDSKLNHEYLLNFEFYLN